MDAKKFDRLTQTLAAGLSRRGALRTALGTAMLGVLGLDQPDEAEAAKSNKCKTQPGECQFCKKGKCKKKGGKKKCKPGKILPLADRTSCSGGLGQCAAGVCILTTVAPTTPAPPPPGPQCHEINVACAVDADCCNGTCGKAFTETALRCCNRAGTPCDAATRANCCSGGCRTDTATCACKETGQACNDNKQCCSGVCGTNGQCAAGQRARAQKARKGD